jgi:hypothetical protein
MTSDKEKPPIDQIKCPKCGTLIPITAALQKELTANIEAELQKKNAEREQGFLEREEALKARETEVQSAEKRIDNRVQEQLLKERTEIEKAARKKAAEGLATEMEDMKSQIREKDAKLEEASNAELVLRKKARELEDGKKNLELEVARKIDEERGKIEEDVTKRITEERHFKDLEKEKQITDMRLQIEELKRKAEQGSQQTQGEVMELGLEELLKRNFPLDQIEPVQKGVRGVDVLQRVHDQSGHACGIIAWESKRTKAWNEGWVQKLKADQRDAKADIAIIVSEVLPKEVTRFGFHDGIWVADYESVLGLATALRVNLIQLTAARSSVVAKSEKMELLYKYLSGPEFRQKVEAIVEAFVAMQKDLNEERRIYEKRWAKRHKQIEQVIRSTAGMYGDMQGLIGSAMHDIPALESAEEEDAGEAIDLEIDGQEAKSESS